MQQALRSDLRLIVAALCTVAGVAAGVWALGYAKELDHLAARGRVEEQLMADRLLSDLQRYRDLAVSLAVDPRLASPGALDQSDRADAFLVSAADKTAAEAIYYVDRDGLVLAASTAARPHGLAQSAYFLRAMDGALGSSFGRDPGFGKRLFQFAAPAFDAAGKVRGAVVVLTDVEAVEISWRSVHMALLLLDADRRVFLSNRSELLGLRLPADGCALRAGGQVVRDCHVARRVWVLDWGPYLPERAIPLERRLERINMTALALMDDAPARQIAFLQAAAVAAVLSLCALALVWVTARRRVLARTNRMLEQRVAERTRALTLSNDALRHEVSERREAEAALRKAQDDLVQAGKLSALGQMSAGISHELNQPLMAIRQFAENGTQFLDQDRPDRVRDNLSRIAQLSGRAARIIRNLRAFARNENEPAGRVDVGQVVATAIELTAVRLRNAGVTLDWEPQAAPLWVRAGEVRLGQVFVNLINNAVDAMTGQVGRRLTVTLEPGPRPLVRIRDTGPGIADPERLFEPFYSTKTVSDTDGMGLGLSISYGLVQSFGGNIRGDNAEGGGAVFTVELEAWEDVQDGEAAA